MLVDVVPSTPDAATITRVAGLLRTVLAGLAGMGVLTGMTFSDSQLSAIAAMLITAVSVAGWAAVGLWSWWQKNKAAQAGHAGSVASAQASLAAGVPTPLKAI